MDCFKFDLGLNNWCSYLTSLFCIRHRAIGPSQNQVYLDFEFDLYRSSNGILLLEDYVIKKEVIAADRIRYEILFDYKTNPLMLKKSNKQDHKLGHKMDRRIVYYKLIDGHWILTNH